MASPSAVGRYLRGEPVYEGYLLAACRRFALRVFGNKRYVTARSPRRTRKKVLDQSLKGAV